MNTVCWVVGEPGCGKTTLTRALLGPVSRLVDKPKWTLFAQACAAGHYTGKTFDGADTLSYTAGPEAAKYWRDQLLQQPLTVLDGDRMSNSSILKQFAGYQAELGDLRLCCIFLAIRPELVAQRRRERSDQDETWALGRRTKAKNFAGLFGDLLTITEEDLPQQVAAVQKFLDRRPDPLWRYREAQDSLF